MSASLLVVTTSRHPSAAITARAHDVARTLGAPFVPRSQLPGLTEQDREALFYVVGRNREEVVAPNEGAFFVQPGLYPTKAAQGLAHPFLRALTGDDERIESLLDGTLGLAGDALHAAGMLGARVTGVEKSPVLQCLLEEGLVRMAKAGQPWSAGAARITLVKGDAADVLRATPDHAFDVVTFDPMMSRAKRAAPGLTTLRATGLCAFDRPSAETLDEAARVARRRVVVKLGKGAPPPPMPIDRAVPGAHVVYYVRAAR